MSKQDADPRPLAFVFAYRVRTSTYVLVCDTEQEKENNTAVVYTWSRVLAQKPAGQDDMRFSLPIGLKRPQVGRLVPPEPAGVDGLSRPAAISPCSPHLQRRTTSTDGTTRDERDGGYKTVRSGTGSMGLAAWPKGPLFWYRRCIFLPHRPRHRLPTYHTCLARLSRSCFVARRRHWWGTPLYAVAAHVLLRCSCCLRANDLTSTLYEVGPASQMPYREAPPPLLGRRETLSRASPNVASEQTRRPVLYPAVRRYSERSCLEGPHEVTWYAACPSLTPPCPHTTACRALDLQSIRKRTYVRGAVASSRVS